MIPIQFSTTEKMRKVSLNGSENLESLVVILGKVIIKILIKIGFLKIKIMPFNPQK